MTATITRLPCDEDAAAPDIKWGSALDLVVFVDGDTPMAATKVVNIDGAEHYIVEVKLGSTKLVAHLTIPAMGALAEAISSATVTRRAAK